MNNNFIYPELSKKVVDAYYNVCKALPFGMLEEVYQRAMCIELRDKDLNIDEQKPLNVKYKGHDVGFYRPDIIVEDKIILELKAVESLTPLYSAQLINYLTITGKPIGYLLNFGENRRFVRLSNPNLHNS